MVTKEARRATDAVGGAAAGSDTQVPLPLPRRAPCITPLGAAADIGVAASIGGARVRQEIPVAVGQHNGEPRPAASRNEAMVAVAIERVILQRREKRLLIPERCDDPLPLRTPAEGKAKPQVRPGARSAPPIQQ